MNYKEFTQHLGKAGLSAKDFAFLMKKHPNSITNNSRNGRIPNELGIIAALLGTMAEKKINFIDILSNLDIQTRKVRGSAEIGKFGGKSIMNQTKNNKE
ncbi:hypothetical protein [Shewanella sp.]|uniref:hypothetical protein n=1 Tax=Shewanella sp. TaxID=50422 RepID=UPI003A9777F1